MNELLTGLGQSTQILNQSTCRKRVLDLGYGVGRYLQFFSVTSVRIYALSSSLEICSKKR